MKLKNLTTLLLIMLLGQNCNTNCYESKNMDANKTETDLTNLNKSGLDRGNINITLANSPQNGSGAVKERCFKCKLSCGCCCGLFVGLGIGAIVIYVMGAYWWGVFPKIHIST